MSSKLWWKGIGIWVMMFVGIIVLADDPDSTPFWFRMIGSWLLLGAVFWILKEGTRRGGSGSCSCGDKEDDRGRGGQAERDADGGSSPARERGGEGTSNPKGRPPFWDDSSGRPALWDDSR